MKKYVLTIILFIASILSNEIVFLLTPQEKAFVEAHRVDLKEKVRLDAVFLNLDEKLTKFLNLELTLNKQELTTLLKQNNFTVHQIKKSEDAIESFVVEHPLIENYLLKIGCNPQDQTKNWSRIILTNRINQIITQLNFTTVEKISKRLYRRPQRLDDLQDVNYIVLTPKIKGVPYNKAPLRNKPETDLCNQEAFHIINFLHPQQPSMLRSLLHASKIIVNQNGKIVFIDTQVEQEPLRSSMIQQTFSNQKSWEIDVPEQKNVLSFCLFKNYQPEIPVAQVAYDLTNKTVLHLGCKQGTILFELSKKLQDGVGIDHNPSMINLCNKRKSDTKTENLNFYTVAFEKEELSTIASLLPEKMIDLVILSHQPSTVVSWHNIIDFAHTISRQLLFETNDQNKELQEQVLGYLNQKYSSVERAISPLIDSTRTSSQTLYLCRK